MQILLLPGDSILIPVCVVDNSERILELCVSRGREGPSVRRKDLQVGAARELEMVLAGAHGDVVCMYTEYT